MKDPKERLCCVNWLHTAHLYRICVCPSAGPYSRSTILRPRLLDGKRNRDGHSSPRCRRSPRPLLCFHLVPRCGLCSLPAPRSLTRVASHVQQFSLMVQVEKPAQNLEESITMQQGRTTTGLEAPMLIARPISWPCRYSLTSRMRLSRGHFLPKLVEIL